ncbi:cupin domain-containing protein [Pseudogracilibacillus sp. SE30717A]|uniref:cupin domain-containing protein n=1 Tax=Pseudogracilibacillus sp. SE30717A TaxID=3098293 RepID=UPI00300E3EC9
MIRNTMETTIYENLHGGSGKVEIRTKINQDDKVKGLKLFAEVTLMPHSSIGYHYHRDEAEGYYITEGSGVFIDHNEERKEVRTGDLCLITKGQSHGIENVTNNELKFIAIVY